MQTHACLCLLCPVPLLAALAGIICWKLTFCLRYHYRGYYNSSHCLWQICVSPPLHAVPNKKKFCQNSREMLGVGSHASDKQTFFSCCKFFCAFIARIVRTILYLNYPLIRAPLVICQMQVCYQQMAESIWGNERKDNDCWSA